MILVDTSIWIEHLKLGLPELEELLRRDEVLVHPFVIGEIALGNVRQRGTILRSLSDLPAITVATPDEVLSFIEANRLAGQGIGYVDTHLLAAARLTDAAKLWTFDKNLSAVSRKMKLAFT